MLLALQCCFATVMIVVFDLAAEQAPASEIKSPEVFLGDNDTLYVTVPESQQTQAFSTKPGFVTSC